MHKIKLFLLLAAVSASCFSCAGWPWNKKLPAPPEGMEAVKLSAVIVGKDAFDRIAGKDVTYEQASDIWHRGPSMTIFFREARYKKEKTDPVPPSDAVSIRPEGAKYPIYFSGFEMRRFEDKGVIALCGEGKIYYGKALIAVSPTGTAINNKAVEMPDLTVHSREWLEGGPPLARYAVRRDFAGGELAEGGKVKASAHEYDRDKYEKVPDVGDISVSSDGHWWEGVKNVSP